MRNFLCEATGVNCTDPRCKRGSCIMEQEIAKAVTEAPRSRTSGDPVMTLAPLASWSARRSRAGASTGRNDPRAGSPKPSAEREERIVRELIIAVAVAVALALAPLSAKAEERNAAQRGINNDPLNVYWALYRSKNADPEVRLRASELFSGIVFALGYANASLNGDNRAPLYCQPEKLFLNVGQHIDMLQRWVRDQKAQMPDGGLHR
jgi:hypothetical protein